MFWFFDFLDPMRTLNFVIFFQVYIKSERYAQQVSPKNMMERELPLARHEAPFIFLMIFFFDKYLFFFFLVTLEFNLK